MEIERIRASYSVTSKSKAVVPKTVANLQVVNLLDADRSDINANQWTLLSNLLSCYDEYSGLIIGRNFMTEQNKMPARIRFKPSSIIHLFQLLLADGQLLYTKNRDFLALSTEDRSILIENTLIYTTASSVNFINSQIGIMDLSIFYEAMGVISNPGSITIMKRIASHMISDHVMMKLCLAIMSFSTLRPTFSPTDSSKQFSSLNAILNIQDSYIELAWRYLIYTYKLEWTVRCFSDMIRFLFIINEGVVQSKEVEWYHDTLDSVTQQTKDCLTVSD
ncbi:unnamed protein product [Adineta ricciae]|uniref:Uncharacterized protein n=1 Tax=Adineta ricciae TaxID=249248 RepID=A0A814SCI8_ADIRI|nr:unnamed protein product [Adineta ricciae]CAF1452132.1 unnamed protein product [Adineta ricciae]